MLKLCRYGYPMIGYIYKLHRLLTVPVLDSNRRYHSLRCPLNSFCCGDWIHVILDTMHVHYGYNGVLRHIDYIQRMSDLLVILDIFTAPETVFIR
jgi:hypothetical protein